MYTLPAIQDPNTGKSVVGSSAIAQYLDSTYPETPRVIPEGTEAFHEALQAAFDSVFMPTLAYLIMPIAYENVLNDASKVHFKAAREKVVGGDMAIWSPAESDTRAKQWVALEKAFGKIAGWLDAAGKQRQFFMRDRVSFADFILGARLIWMKRTLGKDSDEWRKVAGWHGGRWAKFLEALPQESLA